MYTTVKVEITELKYFLNAEKKNRIPISVLALCCRWKMKAKKVQKKFLDLSQNKRKTFRLDGSCNADRAMGPDGASLDYGHHGQ